MILQLSGAVSIRNSKNGPLCFLNNEQMKKDFDAVEMMRSIRSKLQDMYEKEPDVREKRLMEIRKKYRIRQRRKALTRT